MPGIDALLKRMISVVSPIYNECATLRALVDRIRTAMELIGEPYEIILVDNGSSDDSLSIMKAMRAEDSRVKYVSLSRNFGHQGGILAGMHHARGTAVISLDGDLQHPPEIIPELVARWREGFEVVYTTKQVPAVGGLRGVLVRLFYRLISAISELRLSHGQSDFRLLDRSVVDVIRDMPEQNMFLRGLVDWVGFRQTAVAYRPDERLHGETKFSLRSYVAFALDGVLSFSTTPLRFFFYTGFAIATVCLAYVALTIGVWVTNGLGWTATPLPPGWATLAVGVMFLGGVQLLGIGILGEYLGRVFTQTKARPRFITREIDID